MILKNFRWNVVGRTLLIVLLALLLAYVLLNSTWFFTPLVVGILLAIAVWNLIAYIERTNRDLTYFILSIKQGGFTTSFHNREGKSYQRLSQAFNDVIREFQKINLEKETQFQYLKLLTENVSVGILSFDEKGVVQLINPAAATLLEKPYLKNLSELKFVNAKLYDVVNELKSGQKQLLRTVMGQKEIQLSVQAKELVMNERIYKIVLLQDLNQELEDQEVYAWQRLIRVLTHEIMNSVTPIVALTEAINKLLNKEGSRRPLAELDADDKDDLYDGIQTIESRSKGLMHFVNAYKDYTRTPELILRQVDISDLIERVLSLLGPELEKAGIKLKRNGSGEQYIVQADPEWIEQVLINILKNAIEALEGKADAMISIGIFQSDHVSVEITDNGPGMDRETLGKVFIPFFTTKKKGSGIGLSLSRQIMKLHKGTLTAESEPGKGTRVLLRW